MNAIPDVINRLLFAALLVLGAGIAFYAQASSPNYLFLFKAVAPFVVLLLGLVLVYFLRVRRWSRWLAVAIFLLAVASFSELGLRVFAGASG